MKDPLSFADISNFSIEIQFVISGNTEHIYILKQIAQFV